MARENSILTVDKFQIFLVSVGPWTRAYHVEDQGMYSILVQGRVLDRRCYCYCACYLLYKRWKRFTQMFLILR